METNMPHPGGRGRRNTSTGDIESRNLACSVGPNGDDPTTQPREKASVVLFRTHLTWAQGGVDSGVYGVTVDDKENINPILRRPCVHTENTTMIGGQEECGGLGERETRMNY